jgi:FixJ family two-component response regulator
MQQTANERSDKGRVAVVDDDEAMLGSLRRILSFFGFAADAYQSAQAAIAAYKADPERYDAILTDLNMPGMDGLELMRQIKTIDKDAVIVVLTGFPSADNAISALRNGAFDFLEKPYSNEVLCLTLERGVEHKRLRKARAEYQQALERELGIRTKDLREALSSLENPSSTPWRSSSPSSNSRSLAPRSTASASRGAPNASPCAWASRRARKSLRTSGAARSCTTSARSASRTPSSTSPRS